MKKILFGLYLIVNCSIAQNKIDKIDISYGEELADDKQKIVKIIGESNNRIYALANRKDDYFFKTFDAKTMKLLSSNDLVMPKIDDKDVDFQEVYLLNDKIYAFGTMYNRKDKIFNLFAAEISESGVLSTKTISLFQSEVAKKSERGQFYFKLSPDSTNLLIMHTSLFKKEDMVRYEMKMYDENLKNLFSREDDVKFDDNKKDYEFNISDFDINFQNDVFLTINESYRDSKKKEQIEKFEVHAFKKSNNYQKEVIKVNIVDKEIINCKLFGTNKNVLQIVGFYSSVRENGRSNKELKGVYNASIDLTTNTVSNLKFNEFDYETKVKLLGERRAKKGKDLKPLYNISNIIEKEDGGLIILSEMSYAIIGQSQGFGPISFTPVTYIQNEIIITSLRADGSYEWGNVVPKEQMATVSIVSFTFGLGGGSGGFSVGAGFSIPLGQLGSGPEYLGSIPMYKDGVLTILFNDNPKNVGITDIEEIKSTTNFSKALPTVFEYDKTGKLTRKDPEEILKNELIIRPNVYFRKSRNEFIIYSSRKKMDKLGRLYLAD